LPLDLMQSILTSAAVYVDRGTFTGIRFSTRPDCLGSEVIRVLSRFPVQTVELGVQSLSDTVLQRSLRGYCAKSVHDSAKQVRYAGWDLGVQLMVGLPGDSKATFIESVHKSLEVDPDFLRIYPTLVLEGTVLADQYREGAYAALTLDEAVDWVVAGYSRAHAAGVSVIRMGLHSDRSLEETGIILAGPYHPAFGHMVKSRWWRERLDREFACSAKTAGPELNLRVPRRRLSEVIGLGRSNLDYWKSRWGISINVIGDPDLAESEMRIEAKP